MKETVSSVDDYIAGFSKEQQAKLNQMRMLIRKTVPEAIESMSYGMPAYKLNRKPLVYFGGFKNHIGFYATPTSHEVFQKELSGYTHGKGSVQFPINSDLPVELIEKMVKFKVQELSQDKK